MITILLSWIIIFIYSVMIGYAFMHILSLDKQKYIISPDCYFVSGLMVISVFAQFYSILGGVNGMAFGILSILAVCSGIYSFLRFRKLSSTCTYNKFEMFGINLSHVERIRWIMLVVAFVGVLLWTDLEPQHYDTYLYHAQAIHWAEDYGVVPGLGNLHFRLAYNSAFMPLQALFSFKWLFGQSLHTINGLVTFLTMVYFILTIRRDEKLVCSDYMKVGVMLYIAYDSFHISSPNTDTFALLLVFFICTKWVEFAQKKVKEFEPYGLLSIWAVFATSLKMSAGIVVLICLYPAFIMIKQKKWFQIMKHIFIGVLLLLPLMIRGYIISGYLLYPYDILSFGNPDWKMNIATMIADRAEIISWGRGTFDASRNSEPIWKWIGEWYAGINPLWKVVSLMSLIAVIYLLLFNIRKRRFKDNPELTFITLCSFIFVAFWMLSAPLPRYGIMYMIILICIALYFACMNIKKIYDVIIPMLLILLCVYAVSFGGYCVVKDCNYLGIYMQADYANKETEIVKFGKFDVATPVFLDQTGYEPFPSVIGEGYLDLIELRGETLADGFRLKNGE